MSVELQQIYNECHNMLKKANIPTVCNYADMLITQSFKKNGKYSNTFIGISNRERVRTAKINIDIVVVGGGDSLLDALSNFKKSIDEYKQNKPS